MNISLLINIIINNKINRKTWNLVSNPANDDVISWTANGRTFTVWKPDLLEEKYLPETFKHSNFASFVRQLNNYGFRKCHSDRFEFGVTGFEKNKPELLTTLKRNEAPRMKSKTEFAKDTKKKEKELQNYKLIRRGHKRDRGHQ